MVDDQVRCLQGTGRRRIVQAAADMGLDVEVTAAGRLILGNQAGDVDMSAGQIEIQRIADRTGQGQGRRIGGNIPVG